MTISMNTTHYGTCPQCGGTYVINGEPHFCPPKKRLPKWLKDVINERLKLGDEDLNKIELSDYPREVYLDHRGSIFTYQGALKWVLSLEDRP